MPEKQVVVRLKGGLGNQLFQYALGRHLSMLLDAELVLDCSFLDNRIAISNATRRTFEVGIFSIQARLATEQDIPLYPTNAPVNSLTANIVNYLRFRLKGFRYVRETSNQYREETLQDECIQAVFKWLLAVIQVR